MGLGYALTEDFPLKNGVPQAKYGTLGLMRSTQIPDIHAIYVEKEELLPFAYGAKGIGRLPPYRPPRRHRELITQRTIFCGQRFPWMTLIIQRRSKNNIGNEQRKAVHLLFACSA